MSNINIGVIGTSPIAEEHIKVIQHISNFNILGITSKTNKNSKKIAAKYNIKKIYNNYMEMVLDPKIKAILIIVSADQAYEVLTAIIPFKKPIFIEKPICINLSQASKLASKMKTYKTLNMVGYNRRHYSVFHKGLKIIKDHGELYGITIEGHERYWNLENIKNKKILDNWHFINSSHTIDLIRFFGGEIENFKNHSYKSILKKNDQLLLSFKLKSGAIGSYTSHWFSPGGWSVKLFGNGVTIIYQPLENGITINKKFERKIIKPNKYDVLFKPGFYAQMIGFKNLILKSELDWPSTDILSSIKTLKICKELSGA